MAFSSEIYTFAFVIDYFLIFTHISKLDAYEKNYSSDNVGYTAQCDGIRAKGFWIASDGTDSRPAYNMTGVTAPAQFANNAARRAAGDLVTPLATATVETWYTAGGTFYVYGRYGWEEYTLNAKTVNVAFDGNDIFLQGLSFYFPESWIKGTINGAHFFSYFCN